MARLMTGSPGGRAVVARFMVLSAVLIGAEAAALRRRARGSIADPGGSWTDMRKMTCLVRLESFGMPDIKNSAQIFEETSEDKASTKVLETPSKDGHTKRLLVFESAEGECNPQAGIYCKRANAGAAALLQHREKRGQRRKSAPDDGLDLVAGSSTDCGSCDPDVQASVSGPAGSYLRSMLAAVSRLDKPPQRALSIGLGAGTLNTWLQQRYPEVSQTVAELSSSVADAAPCFGLPEAVKVDVADGRQVLENQDDGSLDVLFIDAFDATHDDVPGCLMTQEFFQTARRKLRPGGVLSMNLHTGGTLSDDTHAAVPSAQLAFSEVQTGTCPGLANRIMVARAVGEEKGSGGDRSDFSPQALLQEDGEVAGWWAEANFAPAAQGKGSATTDATSCSGR